MVFSVLFWMLGLVFFISLISLFDHFLFMFSLLLGYLDLLIISFLVEQVVLAANDLPSINDVTYPELIEIIAKVIAKLECFFLISEWSPSLTSTRHFPVEG